MQYLPHIFGSGKHIFDRFAVIFTVVIVWIYAHLLTVGGAYNDAAPKTQTSCRTDRAGLIDAAPWLVQIVLVVLVSLSSISAFNKFQFVFVSGFNHFTDFLFLNFLHYRAYGPQLLKINENTSQVSSLEAPTQTPPLSPAELTQIGVNSFTDGYNCLKQ